MNNNKFIEFSFPKISTSIVNGVEKKSLDRMPPWASFKKSYITPKDKCRAIITGKKSNITVLDFDDIEEYNRVIVQYPELKNHYTVKSPNGYHIYFLYNPALKTGVDCFKSYNKIDIRNDDAIIIAPPTTYKLLNKSMVEYEFLGGHILSIPEALLNDVGDKPEIKDEDDEEEEEEDDDNNIIPKPEDQQQPKLKEVYFLLSCLSPCYCDNYHKWLKVAIIIFNEVNDYELLDAFSQRSKKYNAVNNLKIWNSFKSSCNQLRIASLKMYAKESNPEKYAKYYKLNFNFKSCNTSTVAEHFKSLYDDKFLYTNDTLYYFNGVYWSKDNKLNAHLNLFLSNEYFNFFICIVSNL